VIVDDKPPLDEALLEHHGVKGMKWGTRKEEARNNIRGRVRTFGNQTKLEYETGVALVGVAALGLAFANSPRARTMMRVPASAAMHYMSKRDNQKKVFKVLKNAGVFINKL
jgi:hypothetical protein